MFNVFARYEDTAGNLHYSDTETGEHIVRKVDSSTYIPTGGCIKCRYCEQVRSHFFCGRKRIPYKAVYNEKGWCSKFEPRRKEE